MNADQEDPLVQGHYEFKGEENYKPTSYFIQKVYLTLNIQLSIVLVLHLIFGKAITQFVSPISLSGNALAFIPEFSGLLIFIIQLKLITVLKASSFKTAIALGIRTIIFYGVIRLVLPADINNEMTLFISLILSVHFALTIYAYSMKETYSWKIGILFIGNWLIFAGVFIAILNLFVYKGLFSTFAIVLCLILVLLYGLYLVYEVGFILDGPFYAINHHQYVYAAFTLQFDAIGLTFWTVKKCKPQRN